MDTATPHPCQDQNWTYTGTCARCGHIETEKETIKASAAHQERETTEDERNDEKYIKDKKDANCGIDGYKTVVTKICTVCGAELATETFTIDATGNHDPAKEAKTRVTLKEPTCSTEGEEEVTVTCEDCGTVVRVRIMPLPATGKHEWADPDFEVTKEATCTEKGTRIMKQLCKNCGAENPGYTSPQRKNTVPWVTTWKRRPGRSPRNPPARKRAQGRFPPASASGMDATM